MNWGRHVYVAGSLFLACIAGCNNSTIVFVGRVTDRNGKAIPNMDVQVARGQGESNPLGRDSTGCSGLYVILVQGVAENVKDLWINVPESNPYSASSLSTSKGHPRRSPTTIDLVEIPDIQLETIPSASSNLSSLEN